MAKWGFDFGTSTIFLSDGRTGSPKIVPLDRDAGKPGGTYGYLTSDAKLDLQGRYIAAFESKDSDSITLRSLKRRITKNMSTFIYPEAPSAGLRGTGTFSDVQPDIESRQIDVDDAILSVLKATITQAKKLGIDLTESKSVRMGCPAIWDSLQRARLARLAEKAGIGLESRTLMDEAVAAGINWAQANLGKISEPTQVLVFDMGGGTLDVAVLHVAPDTGSGLGITVLASEGINVAGDEVDQSLFAIAFSKVSQKAKDAALDDVSLISVFNAWLREVREAKHKLASRDLKEASLVIERVNVSSLTQADLLNALDQVIAKSVDLCDLAIRRATLHSRLAHQPFLEETDVEEIKELASPFTGSKIEHLVFAGGMSNSVDLRESIMNLLPNAKAFFGLTELIGSGKASGGATGLDELISNGLANSSRFSRFSLDRPYFDVFLRFVDPVSNKQTSIKVFNAFERMYDEDLIRNSGAGIHRTLKLSRVWRLPLKDETSPKPTLPPFGAGVIEIRDQDGVALPVSASGDSPVAKGQSVLFKFGPYNERYAQSTYYPRVIWHPSGLMKIFDAAGRHRWVFLQVNFGLFGDTGFTHAELQDPEMPSSLTEEEEKALINDWYDREINSRSTGGSHIDNLQARQHQIYSSER